MLKYFAALVLFEKKDFLNSLLVIYTKGIEVKSVLNVFVDRFQKPPLDQIHMGDLSAYLHGTYK